MKTLLFVTQKNIFEVILLEQKSNLVELSNLIENRMVDKSINEQIQKTKKMYQGDFNRFKNYCIETKRELSFDSLEKYLYHTITEERLKISTFNRRSAAITYFLTNDLNQELTNGQLKRIQLIRKMYDNDEYYALKKVSGQKAKNKKEVIEEIEKLDVRAKAITLLNLVTACRPSEMIRIKFEHIDLDNNEVSIYMKKQKSWINKRLTLQVVNAVKDYKRAFNLSDDCYFVGKVDKHNNYTSTQISDTAYRNAIKKWLKFAPYTLRKTQITAMHDAGADLATIAKQSGHKSLQTINEHYLEISKNTIDKYL